jgi:hypothetical protein
MNLTNFGNLAFYLEHTKEEGNCLFGATNYIGYFLLLGGDS